MKKQERVKIFIVEDNLLYQQMISKQLESLKGDVQFFMKGELCVEKARTEKPDIVVMDYNLEGEMNGLDTLKVLRGFYPLLYAVLFTTEKGLNTEDNFLFYGNFDYIEKKESAFGQLKQLLVQRKAKLIENKKTHSVHN